MGFINVKLGKLDIPVFDLATLGAGFYVGYNEGKGIDVGNNLEYLTKYGPTTFALVASPILAKVMTTGSKTFLNYMDKSLENGNIKNNEGKYLTPEEIELGMKSLKKSKKSLENIRYLKPTLKLASRTALETIIGYTIGRMTSQLI